MTDPLGPERTSCASVPVRVSRVQPGHRVQAICLSERLEGLFTHWQRPRTEYCRGIGCPAKLHACESTWRGYVAALEWAAAGKVWAPVALEITDVAEQDMRPRYTPGQLWEFRRQPSLRGRHHPVRAVLLAQTVPFPLPPTHEIVPALRSLYRCLELVLGVPNPSQARVLAQAVNLPSPEQIVAPEGSQRPSPARESIGELFRRAQKGAAKNGEELGGN